MLKKVDQPAVAANPDSKQPSLLVHARVEKGGLYCTTTNQPVNTVQGLHSYFVNNRRAKSSSVLLIV